jgi:hypothetical protein
MNKKFEHKAEIVIIYSEVKKDEGKLTVANLQQRVTCPTIVIIE